MYKNTYKFIIMIIVKLKLKCCGGVNLSDNKDVKVSKNIHKWEEAIIEIFPKAIPNKCTWYDEIDMLNILFSLCYKNSNNIFYPDGQVLTLYGVDFSKEDNCLELVTEESLDIIKPKKLSFYFDNNYMWSYFRIETCDMLSILDNKAEEYSEKLNSIENGQYNRYVKKSSFLIFPKESPFKNIYNKSFNSLSDKELSQKIEKLTGIK